MRFDTHPILPEAGDPEASFRQERWAVNRSAFQSHDVLEPSAAGVPTAEAQQGDT